MSYSGQGYSSGALAYEQPTHVDYNQSSYVQYASPTEGQGYSAAYNYNSNYSAESYYQGQDYSQPTDLYTSQAPAAPTPQPSADSYYSYQSAPAPPPPVPATPVTSTYQSASYDTTQTYHQQMPQTESQPSYTYQQTPSNYNSGYSTTQYDNSSNSTWPVSDNSYYQQTNSAGYLEASSGGSYSRAAAPRDGNYGEVSNPSSRSGGDRGNYPSTTPSSYPDNTYNNQSYSQYGESYKDKDYAYGNDGDGSWKPASAGPAQDFGGYSGPPKSARGYSGSSSSNRGYSDGYSGPPPSRGFSESRPSDNRGRGSNFGRGAASSPRGQGSARGRSSSQTGNGRGSVRRGGGANGHPSSDYWAPPSGPKSSFGNDSGNYNKRGMSASSHGGSGPNRGSSGTNRGSSGLNRGSSGSNRGSSGLNRGSSGSNRGSSGSNRGRLQPAAYTPSGSTTKPAPSRSGFRENEMSAYETPSPRRGAITSSRAPSRPQDRLLNEVEERKREDERKERQPKLSPEEMKKLEEQRKKEEEEANKRAEEGRKKAEEAAKKQAEEERKNAEEAKKKEVEALRKKLADEAVKAAPPTKKPETPEEIAKEAEIQRKIRESVVVLVDPVVDVPQPGPKQDPLSEVEMSDELRELLNTLTTSYLCKLCSVRMIGPQMADSHYNGKNHIKKLRTFVQTNGRSAGFYLGRDKKDTAGGDDGEGQGDDEKNKAEAVEITVDDKKYCNICKVPFSQASQAEMHYRGKNHAKKLKMVGGLNGTGPEMFECKICCITVTAQEHMTAHLNGARHKLQVRKIDAVENYAESLPNRGRGGLGYRGRGGRGGNANWKSSDGDSRGGSRGAMRGGRGRGDFGGRVDKRLLGGYTEEEMLTLFSIEPSKKFCFDLANYRTPSGSLYCSMCDVSMSDEPQFMLHLGCKKHQDKVLGKRKKMRRSNSLDNSLIQCRRD